MGRVERKDKGERGAGVKVKREEGDEGSDDEQEVEGMEIDQPATSTPKPKANTDTQDAGNDNGQDQADFLPCLECAMIHARACDELKRFEEGRVVLERTVKLLRAMLSAEEFSKSDSPS